MNTQEILVLVSVAAAAAFLGLRFYRQARRKKCERGCGCATSELKPGHQK